MQRGAGGAVQINRRPEGQRTEGQARTVTRGVRDRRRDETGRLRRANNPCAVIGQYDVATRDSDLSLGGCQACFRDQGGHP